ncbi:MAG: hypothetical protein RLZZ332_244 [Actinomycetota bacterium]
MGAPAHAAPPVVAVLVVHEPGDWFAESLASLAMQDYPNLRVVAFLSGSTESAIGDQIRTALPSALVRQVEANPGFGPVANQAMRVVEGTDGFFLFLHDDVALQRDAVTSLVEEAFRSNAAVVGPKLVEWDAPTVLQHVGLDADRTGRLVDVVDPGERDQEQHDAVRDTFALPSACLLVRNDIFRTLGGFSPSIPFFGEELEFCWRVHLLGARVLVNPSAVARHRGAFAARMFLPSADARAARHRVRTVLSCVSLSQIPVVVVRLLLQSLAELVIGVFSGSARNALVGLRAVAAIPVDLSAIVARRRTIAPFRRVPSREVTALQLRSTAQLAAFARHRRALREQQTSETPSLRPVATSGSRTTVLLALSLLALVIVGSRQLIWGEVSPVGQFVAFARDDVSMRDLVRQYLSGWSFGGFGAPTASPTALGALAIAGVVAVGRFSGLLTFVVVGSFFVAAVGTWRLSGAIGDARVRLLAATLYAASPVGMLAVRDGRRDALIVWALLPWILDFARRIAGLDRDPLDAVRESSVRPTGARRSQLAASLLFVVSAMFAFAPVSAAVVAMVAMALLVAAFFASSPWRANAWLVVSLALSLIGAFTLNVPWAVQLIGAEWWRALVGAGHPATGASLADVLSLGVDNSVLRWIVVFAYVPVVLMALVAPRARNAWALRSFALVALPVALRLAHERGLITVPFVEPLALAAPIALGAALAAAIAFSGFLAGRTRALEWRQLFATVSVAAALISLSPIAVSILDGRWSQPPPTLSQLLTQLPDDSAGDYSVVTLGDPRLLSMWSRPVDAVPGLAYGIASDGAPTLVTQLASERTLMNDALDRALQVAMTGESLRAGRLLAPLGVRFVVVPLRDGTLHARRAALSGDVGVGAVARLADQLDLRRVYSSTDLAIFENMAALPTVAVLDEQSALTSAQALEASLLAEALTARSALLPGFDPTIVNRGSLSAGTVHVAVPFSQRWQMTVDGARIAPRVAFGATTAFDAPVAGTVEIRLRASSAQRLLVALQVALWLVIVAIAFNPSRFRGRVRAARQVVEVSLRSDDGARVVL